MENVKNSDQSTQKQVKIKISQNYQMINRKTVFKWNYLDSFYTSM